MIVFRPLAETLDTSRSNFESSRSRRQLFEKGICEQFRKYCSNRLPLLCAWAAAIFSYTGGNSNLRGMA